MEEQGFLKGAFILSLAGFVSKIMGALYRIPLARLIGGEGLGLYQMAYPIYTMILAVSTAGIPVAISILVAEKQARGDYRGGMRIFRIAVIMLAIIGALFTLLLYNNSYLLANKILNDKRAFYAIIAISPAIFITAINSAFRGFFQGNQTMVPTAVSQVIEQFARVTTVLIAAYMLLPYGVEFSAAGATFGAVIGSVFALLVLIFFYITFPHKRGINRKSGVSQEGFLKVVGRIAYIALPLSLGGLVMPVMQVIDATIVPLRLQDAGYSMTRATELFGQLSGMANTLINLPTIITVSLAVSLVPAISEAVTKRQWALLQSRLSAAFRITLLLGLPAAAGLWVLATPISVLLYDIAEVGVSLAVLAPAALFLGLYQTSAAVLQGMSKTYLPVKNLLIGAVVKVSLNYWLTAIPAIGIRGAAFATVCGFLIAFILNYIDMKRVSTFRIKWFGVLAGPLASTAAMAFIVDRFYNAVYKTMGDSIGTVLAVLLGAVVYGCLVLLTGAVRVRDLEMIPVVGETLAKSAVKIGLVRR